MLYKHWSDVGPSDCYCTAVCSPVPPQMSPRRATRGAGLSNYPDLLDILHLKVLYHGIIPTWMSWFHAGLAIIVVVVVYIHFWIWPIFDNNTFSCVSQGPLEPVLNTVSPDLLCPAGWFLHDKDHITTKHNDIINSVRFTGCRHAVIIRNGWADDTPSCLNIISGQWLRCNTNS